MKKTNNIGLTKNDIPEICNGCEVWIVPKKYQRLISDRIEIFYLKPSNGQGEGVDATPPPPPPTGFFQFFSGMGRTFLKTKFLAVGSSLGNLSMKKFSDRTYRLGSKIRQR